LSSILKALKKLEQEESRDSKETTVWPDSVHSARKSIQEKSRRRFILAVLILFCCILIAGFVYLGSKEVVQDKAAPFPKKRPKPITANITISKKTSELAVTLPEAILQTEAEVIGPVVKDKDTDIITLQEDAIVPEIQKPENQTREQEPIPTVTEKIEDLPEIAVDSRLKIQAIAWALDPSRRFVVINNSIVRAGGNIDGITVVAIEENIIHFNEDGKEWRQRFFIR